MEQPRVFEIANEFSVDVRTVLEVLLTVGEKIEKPESRLNAQVARTVRAALLERFSERAPFQQAEPSRPRVVAPPTPVNTKRPTPRQTDRPERKYVGTRNWREVQHQAVQSIIPETYAALRASVYKPEEMGVVVVFHNSDAARPYGVCTVSGNQCEGFEGGGWALREALAPLRQVHDWYRERRKDAPNVYIAFDLAKGQAWFGRSLEIVQNLRNGPIVDAETLEQISVPTVPTTGEPPRLALRAQHFTPDLVPSLRSKVSDGIDGPDEAFLLHEDLLRLAVDSLDGAEVLDPLPIHVNALWVFSRPIIMQRSDGSDRHVRAVWFRQGAAMWRIRTYTAGRGMQVKQVGDQLAGRRPFVPVWDDTRPEQKLLTAIWALMSQGGVTESERLARGGRADYPNEGEASGDLTLVRVKAGTEHALVYRPDDADGISLGASWSVRGHWRHQPYPSLGRDESGRIRTTPIWISSYVKGSGQVNTNAQKVIMVRT
jgi:hypothetical protein